MEPGSTGTVLTGNVLHEWAALWGIPYAAVVDLQGRFGMHQVATPAAADAGHGESWVQSKVRLECARKGHYLWRNNVGAGYLQNGSFLRWGLANDSQQVNAVWKSGDLIGIRRLLIEPRHVGTMIGQFLSREIKEPGWRYTGTDREEAQRKWIELVAAAGGDACFATGEGTL